MQHGRLPQRNILMKQRMRSPKELKMLTIVTEVGGVLPGSYKRQS